MLPIVIGEQTVENGRIAMDENPLDPRKNQRLVVLGLIRHVHPPVCALRRFQLPHRRIESY
jgi:hypothetical protein